jgi:hypothetical protein
MASFCRPANSTLRKIPKKPSNRSRASAAHPNPTVVAAASNPHRVRSSVKTGFVLSPHELNLYKIPKKPANLSRALAAHPVPTAADPVRYPPCKTSLN